MKINFNKPEGIHEIISKDNMRAQIKSKNTASDKIEISVKAKEYNYKMSVVSKAIEDIYKTEDPERLQKLKKDIAIGKYRIASKDIAEAIINPCFNKA